MPEPPLARELPGAALLRRIDRMSNSRLFFKSCHLDYLDACTDLVDFKWYRKEDFVRLAALEMKRAPFGLFMLVDGYTPMRIVDGEGGLNGNGRYQVCDSESGSPDE